MSSKKQIIVVDFDKTIYMDDSLISFCKYIYLKIPWRIPLFLIQCIGLGLYLVKLINTRQFKNMFLIYLCGINTKELRKHAADFRDATFPGRLNTHLLDKLKDSKLPVYCVSASPEAYLHTLAEGLPFENLTGTLSLYKNGFHVISGENCKGIEKIKRLDAYLGKGQYEIIESYSDSMSDLPLFQHSQKAFLVHADGTFSLYVNP